MPTLTHSFEAGVATGTAITAVNSATGGNAFDAFDPTSLGTAALREFTTVHAKTGTLGGHFLAPTGTAGRAAVTWSTSMGTLSTVWMRYYAWHASQSGGLAAGGLFFRVFSATTSRCMVGLNASGQVTLYNAAGTAIANTTAVVPTSAWYRVEASIALSTSAAWEIRYYNTAAVESTTPTETITGSAAALGGTGTIYNFGHVSTDFLTEVYLDDIGISSTGFLGPSVGAPVIAPQVASASPVVGNKTISIAPSTGELLVVFAYTANGGTTFATPTGVTGSTFTLARSEQTGITGWSGVYCWTATVVTGGSYTLTGVATGGNATNMICFRYPVGTTVGAVNGSHLATGNLPSVTLTTTGANSGIAVCVGDFNAVAVAGAAFTTTAGTPAAALSQTLSGNVTGFESYYTDVGVAGSKTVGMSAPSGQAPTTIAVELLAAAAARALPLPVVNINQVAVTRAAAY